MSIAQQLEEYKANLKALHAKRAELAQTVANINAAIERTTGAIGALERLKTATDKQEE